jgi:hypothetical protein
LKENKSDVTDINKLIYAAATITTGTIMKRVKTEKYIKKVSMKVKKERQISDWRK